MITHARGLGFRVEIHAIGDAAAEQVLDALDSAGVSPCERPVLTHCQV
jgi:predicted amidohydrolase YtcJ